MDRGGGHAELEVGRGDRVPVGVGDAVRLHDAGLARVVVNDIVLDAVGAKYHITRIEEENLAPQQITMVMLCFGNIDRVRTT